MAAENVALLNIGMAGVSTSTLASASETVKPDDASGATGNVDPNGNGGNPLN